MKITNSFLPKLFCISLVLVCLSSCASLIKDKAIKDADFSIESSQGFAVPGNELVPYETYTIKAQAQLPGGRWVKAEPPTPNYYSWKYGQNSAYENNDYQIEPNPFLALEPSYGFYQDNHKIAPNPFLLLTNTSTTILLTMASKPPLTITKEFKFVINDHLSIPSYRPKDSGISGQDGIDGPILEFEFARYDVTGTLWEEFGEVVVVHEKKKDQWFLLPVRSAESADFHIDISGSNGVKGSDGMSRYLGKDQKGTVYGDPGKQGGRGGRGGMATIRMAKGFPYRSQISVITLGGRGGAGGQGGQGASNEKKEPLIQILEVFSGYRGPSGPDGSPGANGGFSFVTELDLESMFSGPVPEGFDRSRLKP